MKSMKFVCTAMTASLLVGTAYAADTASITGKVVFDGTPPKVKKIKTDADPQCAAMHADKPLMSEEVVVNDNGTLRNVFVYVKSGLPAGKTYEVPKEPVVIEQKGCEYFPHVFGMMAKQLLLIKNDDDTLHNIHALPTVNEEFNKGQPSGSPDLKKTFTKPEVMVKFKCDVHPWMGAYVGVMDNPFFAVTGADGTFSLKGLPAGDYEIVAWHEKYGEQTQKVKVGDGETKTVDFKFGKAE
jgi:Carboxypeptidase regulatory-like domain